MEVCVGWGMKGFGLSERIEEKNNGFVTFCFQNSTSPTPDGNSIPSERGGTRDSSWFDARDHAAGIPSHSKLLAELRLVNLSQPPQFNPPFPS